MTIKERLLEKSGIDPGQYGEAINKLAEQNGAYQRAMTESQTRLRHMLAEVEAVLTGQRDTIRAFPE